MQSDIALLEREGIANGTYQPLYRAATLMKQRDQDPSDLLDQVLQQSKGEMFLTVKEDFPEHIDGIATRLAEKALEVTEGITSYITRFFLYPGIARALEQRNQGLADEIRGNLMSSIKSRVYAEFREYLESTNEFGESFSGNHIYLFENERQRRDRNFLGYAHQSTYEQVGFENIIATSQPMQEMFSTFLFRLNARSARFDKIEELLRIPAFLKVEDYCTAIRGLTEDAI